MANDIQVDHVDTVWWVLDNVVSKAQIDHVDTVWWVMDNVAGTARVDHIDTVWWVMELTGGKPTSHVQGHRLRPAGNVQGRGLHRKRRPRQ